MRASKHRTRTWALEWLLGACCLLAGSSACQQTSKDAAQQSTSAAPARELSVGDPAPNVDLTLHNGDKLSLASLRGQEVVVYFYPKDDTPGCTVEAQGIRDAYASFQAAKVRVLGVSLQDASSHQRFIDKHDLPFDLVVDSGGAVAKAFGVPVNGNVSARQSFLIGADGKLKQVWRKVSVEGHAQELLEAIGQS